MITCSLSFLQSCNFNDQEAFSPSSLLCSPQRNTELQRQLTFTTSSTKKRKLSPQHSKPQNSDNSHDIPLASVEEHDPESPDDLPRFNLPTDEDGRLDSNFPPHIPAYLQNTSSTSAPDYISSAASSPSAAYAGLSIEGERGADRSGSELRRGSLEPNEQDPRRQSPLLSCRIDGCFGLDFF